MLALRNALHNIAYHYHFGKNNGAKNRKYALIIQTSTWHAVRRCINCLTLTKFWVAGPELFGHLVWIQLDLHKPKG